MDSFELLVSAVDSGAVAPIRGTFLIELSRNGHCLARRQDLPPHAFWTADELRATAALQGAESLFIVLSYRWLSVHHPDPHSFHLNIIASAIQSYLRFVKCDDAAVFWDFGSLFQEPRTPEEKVLFEQGLYASNVWYGHTQTNVWMQTRLPDGFVGVEYFTSGWCYVEAAMSSAVKDSRKTLNLGKAITGHGTLERNFNALQKKCVDRRMVPQLPAKVDAMLRSEKVFTNGADVDKVSNLYLVFFNALASKPCLKFDGLGWTASHMYSLKDVLPEFTSTTELRLSSNNLGDMGAEVLASILEVNTSIENLGLESNCIGGDGAVALAHALRENRHLRTLTLYYNNIRDEGTAALANMLQVNASLTTLTLCGNNIGDAGAAALGASLHDNACLHHLWVNGNKIGDEGAVALAGSIKVNRCLKTLRLDDNIIRDDGAVALATAVESLVPHVSLKKLYVGMNQIGTRGRSALFNAKQTSTVDITGVA